MRAYLDYNATTPLDPAVLKAMMPFYSENYANPSSFHRMGQQARGAVESARRDLAASLGVESTDLVFTSGGTESDNLALKGVMRRPGNRKRRLVVSAIEHPAVLESAAALAEEGFDVRTAPVNRNGAADLNALKAAVNDDTALVSLMHVNNGTGVVQPVEEAARIAHAKGALFHTDAVQSFGKIVVLPGQIGADLLSVSAHKICGPKGIGALYVRKGLGINPLLHGGHQEKKIRPGTENAAGAAGFGQAARLALSRRARESEAVRRLRDRLERGLRTNIPDIIINGEAAERVYNTSNVSFSGIEGEMLLINLDLKQVYASAGSACTSGSLEPSHVLTAMGIAEPLARASVRFSIGRFTTAVEIDYAVSQVAAIVKRMRKNRV